MRNIEACHNLLYHLLILSRCNRPVTATEYKIGTCTNVHVRLDQQKVILIEWPIKPILIIIAAIKWQLNLIEVERRVPV